MFLLKIISVIIPYWLVIFPAVVINRVIFYKNTSIVDDFLTVVGGGLFVDNPVYVICWYISFVILLYFFIYLYTIYIGIFIMIALLIFSLFCFYYFFHMHKYFISFVIGIFFSNFTTSMSKKVSVDSKIGLYLILFLIQEKCYCFFSCSWRGSYFPSCYFEC